MSLLRRSLLLERGEKLSATALSQPQPLAEILGGDLGDLQQLRVGIVQILAALIGMDQELIGFDLFVT